MQKKIEVKQLVFSHKCVLSKINNKAVGTVGTALKRGYARFFKMAAVNKDALQNIKLLKRYVQLTYFSQYFVR